MSASGRRGSGSNEALRAALARGETIKQAAHLAGMSERTARRRLHDPEFVESLRALEGRLASEIASRLTELSFAAIDALTRLVKIKGRPEVQLRAAATILTFAARARDGEEAQRRLAVLEAAALQHGAALAEVRSLKRGADDAA